MSRVFETKEITKLLDALIGQTDAVGETHEDGRRLDNLKTLIDVTNWCLDGLQFAMASGYGRPEYSMAEISYTAQCALDEYGRWIADVLDEQIADRKTEPTISKMEQDGKDHGMWVKDRNPNEKEFIENYVRNHHAAEFVVMIKNADRPTTLYHTSEGYWKDYNGDFYDVIAWTTLPKFDE